MSVRCPPDTLQRRNNTTEKPRPIFQKSRCEILTPSGCNSKLELSLARYGHRDWLRRNAGRVFSVAEQLHRAHWLVHPATHFWLLGPSLARPHGRECMVANVAIGRRSFFYNMADILSIQLPTENYMSGRAQNLCSHMAVHQTKPSFSSPFTSTEMAQKPTGIRGAPIQLKGSEKAVGVLIRLLC